ncbi:MAG TPA: hypothetical protein VHX36_04305 [Candidatus Acidoferrales bacterium]|jgi:hypothetical protein|nr:hypothetical protein [Candidatus Acidoferrales bacterium]
MDILWPAIGIGVIVGFIFFVLAQHWRKVLAQQAWTVRRLTERLRDLEEMADPEFRRRLGEAAPMPLEQVFTLTFRLTDRFWHEVMQTSEENMRFIREFGSFVGSVKLDRWRSHIVATVAEVQPDRKETGWEMRSLDFYPDPAKPGRGLTLWELDLRRSDFATERPPSLELVLRENSVDLLGHLLPSEIEDTGSNGANGGNGANGSHGTNGHGSDRFEGADSDYEEVVFFRVPLDTNQLAEFRSHDPTNEAGNSTESATDQATLGASWHAFYSGGSESLGVEWQLRLRDLSRKSQWDRWKILEPASALPLRGRKS